jgi:SAM-dependent methyltransferase
MQKSKKSQDDFIQDPAYAVHFDNYRGLLAKLLKHDPEMFGLDKNAKIVDVGCGYGDLLKILRSRGYKNVMGVEPDPLCRKGCIKEKLDVRNGTIAKTGLPNNFADVVIVNEVFHHIDTFAEAAEELAKILKPKGLLCFLEPSPTLLRRAMDVITFKTPLSKWVKPVNTRYKVMKLEMETGLYPNFLDQQIQFHKSLNKYFEPVWHRQSWFFQFGKFQKR